MKFIVSHFMGGGNAGGHAESIIIDKVFIILQIRKIAETWRLAIQSQMYSGQREPAVV